MLKRWIAFVFLAVAGLLVLRSFTRISPPKPLLPPLPDTEPIVLDSKPPTPVSGSAKEHQDAPLIDAPADWRQIPLQNPIDKYYPLPSGEPGPVPRIQHDFTKYRESAGHIEERSRRRNAVKDAFLHTWKGYKENAWLHDEVGPLFAKPKETYGGWAATLVDSLDVLWLMGLQDEFSDALIALKKIDFHSSTANALNTFETIIRYIGGLIGAYDLAGGKHPILLQKATELGEMIYHAFDTPNHLPLSRWAWKISAQGENQTASYNLVIAELGSLTMEFTRLTQLTGDPKYYDLVHRITRLMAREQMATNLPGLWPTNVNAATENLHDGTSFTLGGQADSVYEYLPKQYLLLNGRDLTYKDMYINAADAFKRYLVYEPLIPLQRTKVGGPKKPEKPDSKGPGPEDSSLPAEAFERRDYEFSPDYSNPLLLGSARAWTPEEIQLQTEGQHLACFAGGMVALGVRAFAPHTNVSIVEEEMDVAERLTAGCVWSYKHTATGVGPERFHTGWCRRGRAAVVSGSDEKNETDWTGEQPKDCRWDRERWLDQVKEHHMQHISPQANAEAEAQDPQRWEHFVEERHIPEGFTEIDDPRYLLRPEAIESVFYLWRITGDPKFQEQAWAMFDAIQKEAKTDIAFASMKNVGKTRAALQAAEEEQAKTSAEKEAARKSSGGGSSSDSTGTGSRAKNALGGLMSGLGLTSGSKGGDDKNVPAGPDSPPTTTANLEDSMESFWPAETLKYFYLMFVEPEVMSLDRFVLNTEAHPFFWREGPPPPRPVKDLYSHWGND